MDRDGGLARSAKLFIKNLETGETYDVSGVVDFSPDEYGEEADAGSIQLVDTTRVFRSEISFPTYTWKDRRNSRRIIRLLTGTPPWWQFWKR